MNSPIALFVYSRPEHTRKTLEALMLNEMAAESILHIFADGAKLNATPEILERISSTRNIIREKQWCKEVYIVEEESNLGLAKSIVSGVSKIISQYGKIIVLEDDIVTSPGFLRYMNDALSIYEHYSKVMHISGYMFPVKGRLPETFFYNTASCWGWGTWERAWKYYNNDGAILIAEIEKRNLKEIFNIEGSYDFYNQLKANVDGRLNTWAVKWYASFFLLGGFSLHPGNSLVNNIGHDSLGENCGTSSAYWWNKLAPSINVTKVSIVESKKVRKLMAQYHDQMSHPAGGFTLNMIKKRIYKIFSVLVRKLKHEYRLRTYPRYLLTYKENEEFKRLANLPRFTEGETLLLGTPLYFLDSASCLFIYKELFKYEIYKFKSNKSQPFILDCGANIGLSLIYFKKLFPNCKIIAFEPDNKVFNILQRNVKNFGLSNIELLQKACWNCETSMRFFSEGADGGRAAIDTDSEGVIEVGTVRLKDFINTPIDLLKIDIEGAEYIVLNDCQEVLTNVQNIFVEYHSFLGKEQFVAEIILILKKAGFRVHISVAGLNSSTPFVKMPVHETMDNQLNIYGFR